MNVVPEDDVAAFSRCIFFCVELLGVGHCAPSGGGAGPGLSSELARTGFHDGCSPAAALSVPRALPSFGQSRI